MLSKNFEYAKGDLIDYYAYEIKANHAKLDYLIKLAKIKGIYINKITLMKFMYNENEEVG